MPLSSENSFPGNGVQLLAYFAPFPDVFFGLGHERGQSVHWRHDGMTPLRGFLLELEHEAGLG